MSTRISLRSGLLTSLDPAEAALLGGHCNRCRRHHFPATPHCPSCGDGGCDSVVLSRVGRIHSHTLVHVAPPGYLGEVPFGVGVVELPEGIRLISRIKAKTVLERGTSVGVCLDTVATNEGEANTYAFEPVPGLLAARLDFVSSPAPKPPPLNTARLAGRAVYLHGVGMHPFGRFPDSSLVDLGEVAVRAALDDAGLSVHRLEAAYCGTVYGGVAAGHKVLSSIGATGIPMTNVEAGCASGAAALRLAAQAVASGQCDTALAFGMEKMAKGIIRSTFFEPWREQGGLAVTPAYFALRAQRLMDESQVKEDHLARVVVKNRANGAANPNAMFRTRVTEAEVLNSKLICDPLRLYMLCSPNEGAAAVIVGSKPSSIRILAAAQRSHVWGNVLGEHTPLSGLATDEIASPTELAAQDAYEAAGIGPADLDVVELQDTDAARELLSYEELSLCGRGDSARWLEEGNSTLTGKVPVNPSGGLLSKGEPLGASALAQVIELTWQLRGRAGARQVSLPRIALSHTVGRGANAAVILLARA